MMLFEKFLKRCVVVAAAAVVSLGAQASDDPPARVSRLSRAEGTVSFAPADSDQWRAAPLNRPLTIGDRLWVDRGSRAELHEGSTAIRLGSDTSLDILNLDDRDTQLKVAQGRLNLRVRELGRRETLEIDTPNLAFVVREPGEYRLDVDPDGETTTIIVRDGSGTAYGSDSGRFELGPDQQARFVGTDLELDFSDDAPRRDGFDRWSAARDEREDQARSRRYVSPEMTGYEDLDEYGSWREEPRYGTVWVPRVAVGWAPYHYGHWAWIAPWGWTWVDDAPWGFAPFHYGRWAYVGSSWCWLPGARESRPVYAPALVAFVGGSTDGGRVNWGISLSAGLPGVAWFALGPGEAYRPTYRSSPTYITEINRDIHLHGDRREDRHFNQSVPGAIAAVPRDAFVNGRPVQGTRVALTPEREREIRRMPAGAGMPVEPGRQSLFGATRQAGATPPEQAVRRDFVARQRPAEVPAVRDPLIRKFGDAARGQHETGRALLPGSRERREPPGQMSPRDAVRPERQREEMRPLVRPEPRPQPDSERNARPFPERPRAEPFDRSPPREERIGPREERVVPRPAERDHDIRIERAPEPRLSAPAMPPREERRPNFPELQRAPDNPRPQRQADNPAPRQAPIREERPVQREERPVVRERAVEAAPEVRRVVPQEMPRVTPREVQREVPREMPRELPREVQREVPREAPREMRRELPPPQSAERPDRRQPEQGGEDIRHKRRPPEGEGR